MNIHDVRTELTALSQEVDQVLQGAAKAWLQDKRAAMLLENLKGVTRQEWKDAARALLMARKTALLEALSLASLEAVAFGHIDFRGALQRAVDRADTHAAERRIREIASGRLNMDLDEPEGSLHSLETGLLREALLEAFVSGQNSRST